PDASKMMVAIFAFSCNSAAYIAEIIRSGIISVDKGQHEAGRSLGLSKSQTMVNIIMPQAIRMILPTYASEFIVLVKETAIVGYIGLADLTKVQSVVTSRTYEAFFPLIIIALIYLGITTILSKLFAAMERKLNEHDKR
ncbi:MAG: amino acid ABC transporter permease, partial [Clostridia bacterium]|nr:amino acid ABC transporter permease [Clostridia bacterium]